MIPFEMREPEDDSDRKLLADVASYGWHFIIIKAEEKLPAYAFTVGLYYTFSHPEILIMGLSHQTMASLLQLIVEKIRSGHRYADGDACAELAAGRAIFRTIDLTQYREYLGYAIWFYANLPTAFPSLQLISADKSNRYPWDSDFDKTYLELQAALYEPRATPLSDVSGAH